MMAFGQFFRCERRTKVRIVAPNQIQGFAADLLCMLRRLMSTILRSSLLPGGIVNVPRRPQIDVSSPPTIAPGTSLNVIR